MENGKSLMPIENVHAMAKEVSQSGLFPGIGDEKKAFTLMMICQSEGLHPMQALKRYNIIEGRPAMNAAAMQAEFQRKGGRITFHKRDMTCCQATFTHPEYGEITVAATMDELKKTGVAIGKGGQLKANYSRHPRQMLHARCISEGINALCPEIKVGMYTPEEIRDIIDVEQGNAPEPPPAIVEETDVKPESTPEEKQARSLRAAMNQEFAGCVVASEVVKIYKKYTRIHGDNIWEERTCHFHNENELFRDIYSEHMKRVQQNESFHTEDAHKEWCQRVLNCSEKEFDYYLAVYNRDQLFHSDEECFKALADRAKELGRFNEETMEFINKEDTNE